MFVSVVVVGGIGDKSLELPGLNFAEASQFFDKHDLSEVLKEPFTELFAAGMYQMKTTLFIYDCILIEVWMLVIYSYLESCMFDRELMTSILLCVCQVALSRHRHFPVYHQQEQLPLQASCLHEKNLT